MNTVRFLINKIYGNTEIQNVVVNEQEQKAIIADIFSKKDMGKIILEETLKDKCVVSIIDGMKRILAIVNFYDGNISYNGKKFLDMSREEKDDFLDTEIEIEIIKEDVNRSELFKRLNGM